MNVVKDHRPSRYKRKKLKIDKNESFALVIVLSDCATRTISFGNHVYQPRNYIFLGDDFRLWLLHYDNSANEEQPIDLCQRSELNKKLTKRTNRYLLLLHSRRFSKESQESKQHIIQIATIISIHYNPQTFLVNRRLSFFPLEVKEKKLMLPPLKYFRFARYPVTFYRKRLRQ